MKHIIQKNGSDCGIASLAMLYGTSYAEMRRIVTKDLGIAVGKNGMSGQDFRAVGNHIGDPLIRWSTGPKTTLKTIANLWGTPAILIMPTLGVPPDPNPTWVHACGWNGRELLDPSWSYKYPTGTNLHSAGLLHAWVRTSQR